MKKALSMILVLVMAAALLVCPAMAAGGGGNGGGNGGGGGGGQGGGQNPLNVVSVTIDGKALAGAEVEADGAIVVSFDRGMKDHSEATAAAISIKGADSRVTFDGDRSFTVSFSGLEAGEYTLVVGAAAQANNGNTLGSDYKVKFSVAAQEQQSEEETPDVPDVPDVPEDEKAPQTGDSIVLYVVAVFALAGTAYAVCGLKKYEN